MFFFCPFFLFRLPTSPIPFVFFLSQVGLAFAQFHLSPAPSPPCQPWALLPGPRPGPACLPHLAVSCPARMLQQLRGLGLCRSFSSFPCLSLVREKPRSILGLFPSILFSRPLRISAIFSALCFIVICICRKPTASSPSGLARQQTANSSTSHFRLGSKQTLHHSQPTTSPPRCALLRAAVRIPTPASATRSHSLHVPDHPIPAFLLDKRLALPLNTPKNATLILRPDVLSQPRTSFMGG